MAALFTMLAATVVASAAVSGAAESPSLTFVSLGDWGKLGTGQRNVAKQMGIEAQRLKASFVLAIGDNFYEHGVRSVNDPLWQTTYHDVYGPIDSLQVPFYAVLGNHDWYGNASAQIDYHYREPKPEWLSRITLASLPFPLYAAATGRRWWMPHNWYSVAYPLTSEGQPMTGDSSEATEEQQYAVFVFIDTWVADPSNRQLAAMRHEQLHWLAKTLHGAATDPHVGWIIVVGHYPIYTSGQHGDTDFLVSDVLPLLKEYQVDAYLCGHDHDLELLSEHTPEQPLPKNVTELTSDTEGVTFVVTGAGGKKRSFSKPLHKQHIYGWPSYGFTSHVLTSSQMTTHFISSDGSLLFTYTQPRRIRTAVKEESELAPLIEDTPASEAKEVWAQWQWVAGAAGMGGLLAGAAVTWAVLFSGRKCGGWQRVADEPSPSPMDASRAPFDECTDAGADAPKTRHTDTDANKSRAQAG
ncbi:unnamed protein product [Vitrella brassicaformis CCMP3155]|uniref:acid phosphatase n=2 Tax=Vitrella brassicaformis TaxID=1169539 RepID=A0A0G4FHS1_VITBC|nr:unnamed protein product [Vitrella brassicaformis CCMP3155]|mmetsp:Transcript_31789/g.78835  ORF Transcript_31789/g.78835 Transcript_31789/m.78835 type:complete len:468 (+) Transcript_31789:143-1546(+)|eukprot:CEM13067.1 unnamed protein product [Vitrella brassicaformis CCMP3155]